MIAYNGRGLNQAECNYTTTEREALALVEGIKKFQPYLHDRKFVVYTDHGSLRWLMNVKDATGRLARWALLLQRNNTISKSFTVQVAKMVTLMLYQGTYIQPPT